MDYKRALSGLDATDLIAFANSTHGGCLLIGVDQTQSVNGVQKGVEEQSIFSSHLHTPRND